MLIPDFKSEMRHKDRGLFIDSLFTNRSAELADEWLSFAFNRDNQVKLVEFVYKHRPGSALPKRLHEAVRGSYNVNWRLEFEDGFSTMIHVPIPHSVAFPDEKIRAEVAAMTLVREHTTIPVPEIYAWCVSANNPTGYGPLIVMEYIEHTKFLEHVIRDQLDAAGTSSSPKKDPLDSTLLKAYRQMANIMLQLSTIEGSAIGYPSIPRLKAHEPPVSSSSAKVPASSESTHQPESRIWEVQHRPVTQSTNDLVLSGGIPPCVLPVHKKTYNTSHEYYQAMADMHLTHLTFQHNDAVLSLPDGRESYVARQLFRKLAREGRLAQSEEDDNATTATQQDEVFKLWCDDMRPTSVLLNDNNDVVGVIDWEMSYFAPASFHYNPPWWLIIDRPEFFKKGLRSWVKEYERHLPLFLKAVEMEEVELKKAKQKAGDGQEPLHSRLQALAIDEADSHGHQPKPVSKRMKQNWDNGRFFLDYCARRNYGFDSIYWKFVDKKFFGKSKNGLLPKRGRYKGRLHLLSEKESAQMETFVRWKREDREEDKIVEWDERDARTVLAACLAGTLGEIEIPKPRLVPWTMTDRTPPPSTPT